MRSRVFVNKLMDLVLQEEMASFSEEYYLVASSWLDNHWQISDLIF